MKKIYDNNTSLFEKFNIIVLIAVLIYFTGWMYCYYLFKYFGILYCTYDIPMYHILIYSYSIIFSKYIFIILVALLISVFLLFRFLPIFFLSIMFRFLPKKYSFSTKKVSYIFMFIILYILFLITLNIGAERMAVKEITRITHGIKVKYIKFILKEDNIHKFPSIFYELNDKWELIYIHSTKDRYYVFSPEKGFSKIPGIVFDIPVSNAIIEIKMYK